MRRSIPAARRHVNRIAIAPAGLEAFFALAGVDHGVDQPETADDDNERAGHQDDVGGAALTVGFLIVRRHGAIAYASDAGIASNPASTWQAAGRRWTRCRPRCIIRGNRWWGKQ